MSEKTFEELWDYIVKRSEKACIPVVQNKQELEYIHNILKECNSYLEIGTAEGNSLYVLANALPTGSKITYVDLGEPHTTPHRNVILDLLSDYDITAIHGDSNSVDTSSKITDKFDAVFIDAGHSYENALTDAMLYGPMAKKFIIFHDICLPDVSRAFKEYCAHRGIVGIRIINSETYGYGVIEV